MADDGKSIADAYRNWSPDSATAAPSEGASIAGAYRAQAATTQPAAKSWRDDYPASDPGDILPDPRVTAAIGRVGEAVAEGWRGGTMQTPAAYAENRKTLLGQYVTNPLVELGNLPFRAVGALGRGGAQAIYEVGEPAGRAVPEVRIPQITLPGDNSITYPGGITIDRPGRGLGGTVLGGPGLGRDLNLLLQVAPVAGEMRAPGAMRPNLSPSVAPPSARFVQELYGEGTPGNPLQYGPAPGSVTMLDRLTGAIRAADSDTSQLPPGAAPPLPAPAQPPPFIPPGTSPYPPGAPRAVDVDAPPYTSTGNVLAYGTPADAERGVAAAPGTPTAAVPPQPVPNNLTPGQVAEFKNIPEALPPAAKPIQTQADAAARADQIIHHFASIGNKEPIPGAEGALPTITGNSGLATLYRAVRDSDTPVPFTTLENASKAKAMSTLEDMGATTSKASQDRLAAAIENRAQTTAPMYKQAFDNKTSADTAGSTQMVEDLLKSKAKQNDNLRPELEAIQKKLAGETDPEQLKGIVDNIDTTMDRLGTEGKGDRETRRVMSAVKDQLISEIGPAAPGFDAAQAAYSRLSRDVDRMKYFQGRKLTDLQGNPTLGNMRSMLDDIRKKQAGDKFHPADSVTPEDVKTIQGIHDQMQREQFTATAGKALGSNTFQNLATNAQVGRLGGHVSNALLGAGGAAVDMYLGGSGLGGAIGGNVLAEGGKYVRGRMAATAEATAERGRAMLMQELRDRLLNIDNKGVDALRGAPPP